MKKILLLLLALFASSALWADYSVSVTVIYTVTTTTPAWTEEKEVTHTGTRQDGTTYTWTELQYIDHPAVTTTEQKTKTESVTIPGPEPTTTADKVKAMKDIESAVAKKEGEIKAALRSDPNVVSSSMSSPSSVASSVSFENGKISATVKVAVEVKNSKEGGDPVRLTTGKLITTETDLSISIDGLKLEVVRGNTSDQSFTGSLGTTWFSSLDSRVIWGQKVGNEDILSQLGQQKSTLLSIYNTSKAAYDTQYGTESVVGYYDQQIALLKTERAGYLQDRLEREQLRDASPYSEVKSKINETLVPLNTLIAELDKAIDTTYPNLKAAFRATNEPIVAQHWANYQSKAGDYDQAVRESDRSAVQKARNEYSFHVGDPDSWTLIGLNHVVLVGENGTGQLLTLLAEPDYSAAQYADHSPNYYPSGSDLSGLEGTGEKARLTAEGTFEWTKKNGEVWTYSLRGQLVQRKDSHGNVLNYRYRADDHGLQAVTDKRGRTVLDLGVPDSAGRVKTITDLAGRTVSYSYSDSTGYLSKVTDSSNDTIEYQYAGGRLSKIFKPDTSSRNYVYDLITGKVSSDADEENNSEFFEYLADAQGKPYTRYTDPSGVWEKHFYDPVKFFDTRVEYANGTSVDYQYDEFDRVKKETWNSGRSRSFTYDANANLLNRGNLDGTSESWTYTTKNLPASYTDPRGYTTTFSSLNYDITGVDYPGADYETYTYASDGTLSNQRNPKGGVRSYDYDASGFVSKITYTGASVFDEQFVNDALGRVTSYQDPAGVKTYYRYRADGSVQSVIYPDGRAKVLTYNNRKDKTREETRRYLGLTGDQVAALSPEQFETANKYEVLDFSTFVYDKRHLVTKMANSLGQLVRYSYDGAGKVLTKELVDEKGVRYSLTTLTYNAGGQLASSSTTGKGINQAITHQYLYDDQGRLARERDERGVWSQYAFDDATGNVSGQAVLIDGDSPDTGSWKTLTSLSYTKGQIIGSEDYKGTIRQFSYDNRGRLNKVEARWQGLWTTVQEQSFDPSGGVSERIEGGKTKTQWDYDMWGNTVAERNALALKEGRGASKRIEYDGRGLVAKATDDAGLVTEYTWDNLRRLEKVTEKDGGGAVLSTMTWSYRFVNKRLNVDETDKRGTKRTRVYDALSRVVEEISGYGKSKLYQYNMLGQVTKVTDETDRITTLDYDGLGRKLSQRQGGQVVGRYTYDGAGNLLSVTDGENRVNTYQYDRLGRLTTEKQGVTNQGAALTTNYTYNDDTHRVVRTTGSFTHTYSYDEWARLSAETDAANNAQSYRYDTAGNLTAKIDYKGQAWSYGYNALNQIELVKVDSKVTASYQYDRLGRLTSAISPDAKLWYEYDVRGNLVKQEDDTGAVYTYGYDAGGLRISRQRDDESPVKYTWGKEGELTALEDSAHNQSFFSYDEAGREIQVVETNGMTRQTQYDDVGRVSFIREVKTETRDRNRHWDSDDDDWSRGNSDNSGSRGWNRGHRTPVWGEAYAYNDAGQVSLKANLNGDVTLFDYDDAGRLDQARYSYGTSGRWEAFEKELKRFRLNSHSDHDYYSPRSLKNTVKQMLGDVYYQMGGLSSVRWDQKLWTETYQYDSAGNRKQTSATRGTIDYTYDANNRLTKAGNRTYTYDANGNQLTETVGGETVTMGYTEDNRIKSYDRVWTGNQTADDPEAEDETPHKVSYTYDPLGRRSGKTQRGYEGTKTQEYQYEGLGLDLIRIADAQKLVATEEEADDEDLLRKPTVENSRVKVIKPRSHQHDETNGIEVLYANGRVFSSLNQNKGLTIYTTDYLGSVRFTTNSRGSNTDEYNYDAFGTSLGKKPALFGYNGRVYDAVTTNYDYGFRDYAPRQARFTTVDPIQDGKNWYAYVNNDPVNFVDWTGLSASENTAKAEIERAKALIALDADYDTDHSSNKNGKINGEKLDEYDCTGAMSATTQKPYLSTDQLMDPNQRMKDYEDVGSNKDAGTWTIVQYTDPDTGKVDGHAQMTMGDGTYFDSVPDTGKREGPSLTKKPVETYLEEKGIKPEVIYVKPRS